MRREKHYIAVDRTRVMRCKWCGTTESNDWIGSYCSTTCSVADSWGDELCAAVIFLAMGALGVFWFPTGGLFFVISACCPLIVIIPRLSAAREARKKVPRDSRRIDKVFDKRYLHCENCGAPLEMMDGKTAMKCSYCGTINRTSYT